MMERSANGTFSNIQSRNYRGRWQPQEITALRVDPLCVLPGRSLLAQWKKCAELAIPRDRSLYVAHGYSAEALTRRRTIQKNPEQRRAIQRRCYFRRRVRANPEPILADLRKLARGHPLAEDIVIEGFATVLRLAIPAAEAFKLAKAEVNRTSAQPFKEQSFNPDIDYAGRETGRQVSKASDIRPVRGEG